MEHIMMISHKERLPYTNICTEGVFSVSQYYRETDFLLSAVFYSSDFSAGIKVMPSS